MSKINETNYPRRTQANYADTDMLVLQAAGGNTYTTRIEDMREDYQKTLAPTVEAVNDALAPAENGSTASQAYAIGEHFMRDGAFCTAIAAIAIGGSFTLNTNYKIGTVADDIEQLSSDLAALTSNVPNNITSRLGNLSTAIAEQNLEKYGYKIGDYFLGTGSTPYVYWLADLDTFYGGYNSYAVLGTHHVGIVVDTKLTSKWNDSVVAYKDSTLHTLLAGTVLAQIKTDITARLGAWSSHMLAHDKLYNAIGTWAWSSSNTRSEYISALTESQIYGAPIWSVDSYQQGEGDKKLTVFDKFKYNRMFGNASVWLRSIAASSWACAAGFSGFAIYNTVTNSLRVAGLILIY